MMTPLPAPFRRLLVCTECSQVSRGAGARGSAGRGELVDKLPGLAFYCPACAAAELGLEPRLRSL